MLLFGFWWLVIVGSYFLDMVSLCSPAWPEIQRSTCFCLHPISAEIKGMYHYSWPAEGFIFVFVFFDTGFPYVALAIPELTL